MEQVLALAPDANSAKAGQQLRMGGLIAYIVLTGGFIGLALVLYYALRTVRLI
jgi:hypothetical protein